MKERGGGCNQHHNNGRLGPACILSIHQVLILFFSIVHRVSRCVQYRQHRLYLVACFALYTNVCVCVCGRECHCVLSQKLLFFFFLCLLFTLLVLLELHPVLRETVPVLPACPVRKKIKGRRNKQEEKERRHTCSTGDGLKKKTRQETEAHAGIGWEGDVMRASRCQSRCQQKNRFVCGKFFSQYMSKNSSARPNVGRKMMKAGRQILCITQTVRALPILDIIRDSTSGSVSAVLWHSLAHSSWVPSTFSVSEISLLQLRSGSRGPDSRDLVVQQPAFHVRNVTLSDEVCSINQSPPCPRLLEI